MKSQLNGEDYIGVFIIEPENEKIAITLRKVLLKKLGVSRAKTVLPSGLPLAWKIIGI